MCVVSKNFAISPSAPLSCQSSPFLFTSFQLGGRRVVVGQAADEVFDLCGRRLDVGGLITVESQASRNVRKLLAALLLQMGRLRLQFVPVSISLLASEDVLGQQHQRLFTRVEQVFGKPSIAQTLPQVDLVRCQTLTSFE